MPRHATTLVVSALFAFLCQTQSALSTDPSGLVSTAEMVKKGWIPFNGKLIAVNVSAHAFTVEITGEWVPRAKHGKHCDIYVTKGTKITNGGKPATLKSGRIGRDVGGMAKNVNGKSIALSVEFNPRAASESLYPYATLEVKERSGWVLSPYAPHKPALNVGGRKRGDEILDPYSGKIFLVP